MAEENTRREYLIAVSVRIPKSIADHVHQLAASREQTLQDVYTQALRLGLELVEERDRIAAASSAPIADQPVGGWLSRDEAERIVLGMMAPPEHRPKRRQQRGAPGGADHG